MESPSPVKLKLMRYWVAAAAVLLCILAIWFLIPKQADSNQLFAQYFQPEKLSLQTMDAEGDTLLLLAERNFNSNRFEAASRHLNAYLQNNPNDMEAILALGLAYLNMENYEAALTNFERCIQNEALNQYSALWYQSLVFLKIGKLEECRQGLEKLVATPGADFNAEAKALLQKLP